MTEAARRGASESAAKAAPARAPQPPTATQPDPWLWSHPSEYPGKLTGTNLEQDILDIMMTPYWKDGRPRSLDSRVLEAIINKNTGKRFSRDQIDDTLKNLETRGLIQPKWDYDSLTRADEYIRKRGRFDTELERWANPAAGRDRVNYGKYVIRQPKTYFGSE